MRWESSQHLNVITAVISYDIDYILFLSGHEIVLYEYFIITIKRKCVWLGRPVEEWLLLLPW